MDFSPEKLLDEEFTLGATSFRIHKIPALEAWEVLEQIREQFGKTLDADVMALKGVGSAMADKASENGHASDRTADQISAMARLVLGLPPSFVKSLRNRLFAHAQFRNQVAVDWQPLQGGEDTAFMNLEPVEVYNVLVRCLAVNFFPSFRGLFGRSLSDPQNTPQ